jgi:hypothetical protein
VDVQAKDVNKSWMLGFSRTLPITLSRTH